MKADQDLPPVDRNILVNCFRQLYNPGSSSETRKQADQHLISLQKNPVGLLVNLIEIFEEKEDRLLSFQALVYFGNVLKRNWSVRKYNKEHSNFEMAKRAIRQHLLRLIVSSEHIYMATLFDVVKFVVRNDYPHSYPQFSQITVEITRQILEAGSSVNDNLVAMMKHLREIMLQVGERKGHINRRLFDENVRSVLNSVGAVSINFRTIIENNVGSLNSNICKVSKYSDQILISLMRAAPPDIQDEQQTSNIIIFLQEKLESLITLHNSASKEKRVFLEKNIKSLIYEQGCLQNSKPLILGWTLPRLYEVLFYVITNHGNFVKNGPVRYALIGIRRIFKQFIFYADEALFGQSARAKQLSANALNLRRQCHQFYHENITTSVIENLLNFLLQNPYARTNHGCLDLDEASILQKGQEKELNVQECVVWLIQGMLERFTELTQQLIRGLITNCLSSNWTNLNQNVISNLLSVVAVLPSTHKKHQTQLQQFPILEVLQYVFKTPAHKAKFAPIVSGWLDSFAAPQVTAMTEVLLAFMEQEANIVREEELDVLVGCCQCLNKMILQRSDSLNLQQIVERAMPVSILVLGRVDNPQVLWPMVNLIANVITRVQLRSDLLMKSLEAGNLSLLIQNDSEMMIEALCEMLKGFLCVIPRQMPVQPVYELVCAFLNNHLSKFHQISHEKIFYLWYVAIRQYSPIHNCDRQYIELFYNHFRKNLFRKTATLIYILEEYLLSGLIPDQVQQFVDIIIQCYTEAGEQEIQQCDKLKIAALSFQITLISKYNLEQVNSNQMLQLILSDFCNFDKQKISPTLRNSLLSILNRYLIRFCGPFFNYLQSVNLSFPMFLEAYLKNMQYLTSHTAIKINAIAILSILNSVDHSLMLPHIPFIVKVTLPQVENYNKLLQRGANRPMTGVVDNSPNLRFGSSVLSSRKEAVRREDYFETINLYDLFRKQIGTFVQRVGSSIQELSAALDGDLAARLLTMF